jgi:hypothetical protein
MAVRGVVTFLEFYPADWTGEIIDPLYSYQNYFLNGRSFPGEVATIPYNFFDISDITVERDQTSQTTTITFGATAANVSLVEEAIVSNYFIVAVMYRWSAFEGLENPSSLNIFTLTGGNALSGSSDFTTVSLDFGSYSKTVDADFPARKIPWTILAPLSARR